MQQAKVTSIPATKKSPSILATDTLVDAIPLEHKTRLEGVPTVPERPRELSSELEVTGRYRRPARPGDQAEAEGCCFEAEAATTEIVRTAAAGEIVTADVESALEACPTTSHKPSAVLWDEAALQWFERGDNPEPDAYLGDELDDERAEGKSTLRLPRTRLGLGLMASVALLIALL